MSISLTVHLDNDAFDVKPTDQAVIGSLKKRLHKNSQSMSLEQLAHEHCINGKAYSPSIGDGTADGTTQQQVYVLDFDNKAINNKDPLPYDEQIKPADVEKRLAHVNLKPAFIGYSPSHIPNEWERFRVYIVLDYPLSDKAQKIKGREALGILLPEADPQAGKLGQFFFGSTKGLYNSVQNVTNAPQILFDIADEHEVREKEYRQATTLNNSPKKGTLEPIADLAQKIPMQEAIQAHYSNCSFRQRGRMVNVINHDYGNTSSFFIYEDSNSFSDYARTGNSGKTLAGGVMTFLIEVVKLAPKDAALWIENYLGVAESRRKSFIEDQKREQYKANRVYDEQLGAYVNTAVEVPPQPMSQEEPLPLQGDTVAPEDFPLECLGERLARVAQNVSTGTGSNVGAVVATMLAVLSLCSQGLANVVLNGRMTPLSLFIMILAKSGSGKTTLDTILTKAIRSFERNARQAYEEQLHEWNLEMRAYNAEVKKIERSNTSYEEKKNVLKALGEAPKKPREPRFLYANATIQGLYKRFKDAMPSLGLFADEGTTVIGGHSMKNENRTATIGFQSDIFSTGRADKTVSGEDGSSFIEGIRLTMSIMLQHIIALPLFADAILMAQGILARFLVTEIPSIARQYTEFDTENNEDLQYFYNICTRLLNVDFQYNKTGGLVFRELHLTPEAKNIYIEFFNRLEILVTDDKALASIHPFGKRGAEQALRIAGVLTLAENPTTTYIEADTMSNAVQIASWFLLEILRITGLSESDMATADAERILTFIKEEKLTETTDRYLQRFSPVRIKTRIQPAINVLIEHGYLQRLKKGSTVNGTTTDQGLKVVLS